MIENIKKKIRIFINILKCILKPKFYRQFIQYNKLAGEEKKLMFFDIFPVFEEDTKDTNFDTHYIYHPAWASRIIAKTNPEKHVDISSTLHFCSQLSAFIPTEFYDFRPANLLLTNLKTNHADLTNLFFDTNSIISLSCMHTVEHIGLGRYGDPIDPNGDIKAMQELERVLAINGDLLFVTPVGKPKVQFNAMRIYSYEQIVKQFENLELVEFSLIPDEAFQNGITYNATPVDVENQNYGCGCFWFKKR